MTTTAFTGPNSALAPSQPERRRRERRMSHRVPCRIRVLDAVAPASAVGRTTNVSPSGFSVQVPLSVPEGAWVEALVPTADGPPRRVEGVVIHSRRVMADTFEIGLRLQAKPAAVS